MASVSIMALGHKHEHRWWHRSWAPVWPLVEIQAIDINVDPDMIPHSGLGPDVIRAIAGIAGHQDQHDPSDGMALECNLDHWHPLNLRYCQIL